jgi:hypothetical protein
VAALVVRYCIGDDHDPDEVIEYPLSFGYVLEQRACEW